MRSDGDAGAGRGAAGGFSGHVADGGLGGVAAAARTLGEELFKHCSVLIESLRNADRRRFIDELSAELTEFKQVAFMWQASMGNSLAVLSTNQAAFDHVRDSVAAPLTTLETVRGTADSALRSADAADAPARPVPTMMTVYLRRLAGFTSFDSKR